MKLPEIELSKFYSCRKHWFSQPFTICFVYPKDGKPFVLKGMAPDVDDYLSKIGLALYRSTYWQDGKSRGSWAFTDSNRYVEKLPNGKFCVTIYGMANKTINFRRMPKRWIPEFDV